MTGDERGTKKHFSKVFKGGTLDGFIEAGKVIPLSSFEEGKKVVEEINNQKPSGGTKYTWEQPGPVRLRAEPFLGGGRIYYYASYHRPLSIVEIRQDIHGGTLVRPTEPVRATFESIEPFAIIQRNKPLDASVIRAWELTLITAEKIPAWWATAMRTEIPEK